MNRLEYIDRGKKEVLVFIPGWAMDYRIFALVEVDYNYLVPVEFSPFGFEDALKGALAENGIERVSLFAHSMGGFVAQEFISKYPDLVNEVTLVGVRRNYDKDKLEKIKALIVKGKDAYLYRFYSNSFSGKEELSRFKRELMKDYLKKFDEKILIDSLAYLAAGRIDPEILKKAKKVSFVHGALDRIAPLEEAKALSKETAASEMIVIDAAGHTPFYRGDGSPCCISLT